MDNKTPKRVKEINLSEAIEIIDSIPIEKKKRINDYLKVYDRFLNQKNTNPEDAIVLLTKGVSLFPENEVKIIAHAYAKTKTKSASTQAIKSFVLDKCITVLSNVDANESSVSIKEGFYSILQNGCNESEYFRSFIDEILNKNEALGENKVAKDNILTVIYIFLSIMIDETYKVEPKRSDVMLAMEGVFVEESLCLPNKILRTSVGRKIPSYLDKGKFNNSLANMSYLFYGYKTQSQVLTEDVTRLKAYSEDLNASLLKKNEEIRELTIACSELTEEKEKLTTELQQKATEKKEAEDRLDFEKNRIERQYQSQNQGLSKQYNKTLGLEIDGIEDIIQFLPDEAKGAVQERVDRMRQIISEIGGGK